MALELLKFSSNARPITDLLYKFLLHFQLTIRCKDITALTKEKTARVIPNAVQICTKQVSTHMLNARAVLLCTKEKTARVIPNAVQICTKQASTSTLLSKKKSQSYW